MKKSTKKFTGSVATLATVASIIAPSAAVFAAEASVQDLVSWAEQTKNFYDFNMAFAKVLSLPAAEQPAYLARLAVVENVAKTPEIKAVLKTMDELVANKDLGNYVKLEKLINDTITESKNNLYLRGELTTWGKGMVYTADVNAAIAAVNNAWTQKTAASVAAAKEATAKVANAGSKAWLLTQIAELQKTMPLSVESVTAVNGKDITVQFSKEVDEVTAGDAANYELKINNGSATSDFTVEVDEDDATKVHVVLGDSTALSTGAYVSFKVKKAVLDTDLKGLAADVTKTFTFLDSTAPVVEKVEVDGDDLVVTFNDYVSDVDLVKVNGVVKSVAAISAYDKVVTVVDGAKDLANGNYTVLFANVSDIANVNLTSGVQNVTAFTSGTFTISDNTVAPEVSKVEKVDENTLKITFNKEVTRPTVAVKKNGLSLTASTPATSDNKVWTVDVSDNGAALLYEENETSVTLSVGISAYKAVSDNVVGDAVTKSVVLSEDTTAPTSVTRYNGIVNVGTTTAVNDVIQIRFNEVLNSTADKTKIILTDKDGIRQTVDSATVVADADGDNTILQIASSAIQTSGVINAGTYNVALGAGTVKDLADNTNAAATFAVTKSATSTTEISGSASAAGSKITVSYDDEMTNSALQLTNYKLDNKALPTGTIAYFSGTKATVVLELPAGSIANTGAAVLTISSNVVSVAGATLDSASTNQVITGLVDNVKPTLVSAKKLTSTTVELTFSENLGAVVDGTTVQDDFVVKVNGVTFAVTKVEDGTASDNKVVLTVADYNVNQTVTVKTASTGMNVADAAGNKVVAASAEVTATK